MTNKIAKYIDHTLLKPEATKEDIKQLVEEAKRYGFASVCVHPTWVAYCHQQLKETNVKVCTVIGFPLGVTTTETKVTETRQAIKDGAEEVDMVINIGALKSGNKELVEKDISAVIRAANNQAITKVIIETALLSEEEKVTASNLAKSAGADFVKTSTGFSTGGATVEDVRLMRETVGNHVGVKASGGIRSLKDLKEMIEAGANRIGASAGVSIVKESSESN
jgi:deoxyribose-phosphate aldolase